MTGGMFRLDEEMADLLIGYCRERLSLEEVPLDHSGDKAALEAALDGLVNERGSDVHRVLDVVEHSLAPAVISCDSPRFLSFIPAAPTKAALLFDMVVSSASLQAISWLEAAGAVAAENQVLALLARRAGMPEGAGGCFVSGGSAANLSALAVARDEGRVRTGRERVRIAVSEEAHSSIGAALHLLGVDPLVVPTADHRLLGARLRDVLDGDPARDDVVGVVATAGTTNAGMVDDLEGVGEVARGREMWFHVDGAYGGAAIFSTRARGRLSGASRADSFVVDPHKWLFAPFDCAALVYRDPERARRVHTQHAGYLEVLHRDASDAWNPSDYAYHLTRRARGLPLWFSLAVHGTDAYGEAIDAVIDLARRTAELVERTAWLELVREPELSIVLFRRRGWERDDYERWSRRLLRDQIAFVVPSVWEGEPVARLAFLHPGTTLAVVEEVLATTAPPASDVP
ncbi:MAG TPA: pyridoxal-dependent decarboxylase [Acidimicrobiales bacterium]|nr:pyridoxal-dependent decarboxylase [Acidimicrobiales bacterium]